MWTICLAPPGLTPALTSHSREQEAVGSVLQAWRVTTPLRPGVPRLLLAHCRECPGSTPLADRYSVELTQATSCPFLAVKLGY